MLDKLWRKVYRRKLGECFTLDLSRSDELKTLPLHQNGTELKPVIRLDFSKDDFEDYLYVYLHNQNDLSVADNIHPIAFIDVSKVLK